MKRFLLVAFFTAMMVAVIGCSSSNEEESAGEEAEGAGNEETAEAGEYVIKAGHAGAEDHFVQDTFLKFKELVEENSDGQITVEVYPNGQLGGEREMIEATQLGNQTLAAPSSAPLASFSDAMLLWDLPYLFTDHEMAHEVLDGEIGQQALDALSEKGLIGLGYWENGFRHLINNKHAVASVDDMNGLKMRTLENPMQIEAWDATGANATPMAFTELYSALQQGTVDAAEGPLALSYAMKFYEVQDYLTMTSHVYSPWPVVINQEFFEGLPEDLQQVVTDATIEVREYNRGLSKEDEEASMQLLIDEGMEVTELSDEAMAEFKDAMMVVYDEIKEKVGEDIFDKLMEETTK